MDNSDGWIRVRGARLHNLRDVDIDIPRDRLVAFTGISGSGKSSLAFGTIHAEAQRRYFESVAPFARRLIHQAADPRVREVTGLPPAVALEQRQAGTGARSSLGTVTTCANTLRMLFSRCGTYPEGLGRLDSDHFSTNTAVGACSACGGLGRVHRPTEASMVPDPSLSIAERAIASWPGAWLGKNYRDILATLGYDIHRPWRELPEADRDWILFTDEEPVVTVHAEREAGRIQRPYQGKYASAARHLMRTLAESKSETQRRRALRFVETTDCERCGGRRLNPDALSVTWRGRAFDEAAALPLAGLLELLVPADDAGDDATAQAEELLVGDLRGRIEALVELGLGHLSLDRPASTLSTGELQRARLGTQLRSGLFGVVYVLDEPSAGLHPKDSEALMRLLRRLVASGNSVLIVEHDMHLVQQCDHVVDVGPGAGTGGGRVLHCGPVAGLAEAAGSVTARYLDDPVHAAEIRTSAPRTPTGTLTVEGVTLHNLRDVDLEVPLGLLSVLTGVSGSGKSSVLTALAQALGADPDDTDDGEPEDLATPRATWRTVSAPKDLRLVVITQKPIGRTPRSNLATYTGLFDHVRKLYAATPAAKERGFGVGRFSFNVAEGRCATCQGEGAVAVELMFMPGTWSTCPDCDGARYDAETLEVTWQGLTIADVLALTVDEALPVFADEAPVHRALEALTALGLGYLTLGQPATELSGGEAQRIKLASELQRARRGQTLYLLDEPTTGLHPADTHRLLNQLHALVDQGATVLVAEHDAAAAATADHVIEMGPGGGDDGGRVVGAGPVRS
ncbi:excinuclease ABC subunit UvrA [Mariniluteicoccus endophyticus]